ncbi:hypothetical protein [Frankia nepalensis]|uniref:hypothetical protein n=1 Tax=Frankia nepalensis TaxID=1836974 RepID=UPI001EE4A7F4|nr:hypothetical protein [Frankia nepalensis]
MRRLGVHLTLTTLWLTALPGRLADRIATVDARARAARRDRGDALATAVITVGLVLIAAAVIYIIRQKAVDTANNICTNTDPTTCQ